MMLKKQLYTTNKLRKKLRQKEKKPLDYVHPQGQSRAIGPSH